VFFGGGEPLLSGISKDVNVKIKEAFGSKEVTHVTFELEKRNGSIRSAEESQLP
jgi:hypothetical protein